MIIEPEAASDQEAIFSIHLTAFGREDEGRIVERMRELPEYIPELSLVAREADVVVGHVLLSRMHHERPEMEGKLLGLGPIGVRPEHQRRGVGSALMRASIERAQVLGLSGILLIGHPTYYPRFGFQPASTWGIRLPFEVPDDVAMGLELRSGSLANASGSVRYSSAFDATEPRA